MQKTTSPNPDRTMRRWGWAVACATLVIYLVFAILPGCSAQRRYKTLSVFFDGVPDPNAPVHDPNEIEMTNASGQVQKFVLYQHKPFAAVNPPQCPVCHERSGGNYSPTESIAPTVCLKCHGNIPNEYPIMHGPVANTECLLCHNPHESLIPHILKEKTPDLCIQCHIPELLPANPPDHMSKTSDCLSCHYAHGGTKHGLLRPRQPQHPATTRGSVALDQTLRILSSGGRARGGAGGGGG